MNTEKCEICKREFQLDELVDGFCEKCQIFRQKLGYILNQSPHKYEPINNDKVYRDHMAIRDTVREYVNR